MQKLFLGVSAFVLTVVLGTVAQAQPPHRGYPHHGPHGFPGVHGPRLPGPVIGPAFPPVVTARPYYLTHGVRFPGGYYYIGRHHNHWAGRVWDVRFGRYHYWDPYLNCYFYWSGLYNCYLPCGSVWLP